MAKGQHLSRHQQGIVRRYYEHQDARIVQKLQELVSDLSVAESEKATQRLWKSVETALARAAADPVKAAAVVASRSVEGLAALVGELSGPGRV